MSLCGSQSDQIHRVFFFFETCSPATSLSMKNVIFSTCSGHRNRIAALGFPTRYRACSTLQWKYTRILAVHSPSGRQICFWPNRKASCTKICVVLHVLSSELDTFFRLTPTCLVVNILWISKSSSSRFTRLGVADSQTKLRLHECHDFQVRINECSQAIRVEYQEFLRFLKPSASRPARA